MPAEESEELLQLVCDFVQEPANVYRHTWHLTIC